MPPKAVSLAYAGKKLTGPPEGYGRKKELQVKRWISGMPLPDELERAEAGSVVSLSEIGESREELYRSLRDSTDGYGLASVPSPSPTAVGGPGPGISRRSGAGLPQPPSAAATRPGLQPPHSPAGTTAPLGPAGRPTSPGVGIGAGTTSPASKPPQGPRDRDVGSPPAARPTSPAPRREVPGSGGGNASSLGPAGASGALAPSLTFPPDAGLAATGGSASRGNGRAPMGPELELLGSGQGYEDDAALACGLLLARIEVTLPAGAAPEEKYRRALMLALEEHQRFQDQVRRELASVREIAAEARAEAQARAMDLEVAARRAAEAEEELGRARAEALTFKQQVQQLQIEVEDGHEAREEQLSRTQAELSAAVAQLKEQSARATGAVEAASAEATAVRSQLVAMQREMATLHRCHERELATVQAKTVSLEASLDSERAASKALRAERDRLQSALQAEAAARSAAEESERQALRAAAQQVRTQGRLQAATMAAESTRQRVAAAAQRNAAVRAENPAAAAVDQTAGAAAAASQAPLRAATAARSPPSAKLSAAEAASPGPLPAKAAAAAATGPLEGANGGGVEAARADGHRALRMGLASERQQLLDLAVQQRRAAAAAELADARVVEAALAAAPEPLRALGLAFRAYIVGGGAGAAAAAGKQRPAEQRGSRAAGSGGEAGAPAAALAAKLSAAGYRVYVDPLTVQPSAPQLYEVPSCPLVGLSAAVVVLAAPGLLRRPMSIGELCAAARHGCTLVVLCPPGLELESLSEGEEPPLVPGGGVAPEQMNLALDALRAAWPSHLPLSGEPSSPALVASVTTRLGLTDPQLALLPPDALRALAVSRTRTMPDLVHLNAAGVPALGPGQGPGVAEAGSGAGTGAALVGGLAAAGLPGLQHLGLNLGARVGAGGTGASGRGGGGGAEELVRLLCSVLAGNTTLTSLTLRGCSAAAARTITEAVLQSPACRVATITVSCRVPVAQIAGRPGAAPSPPADIIDLAAAGAGGGGGGVAGGGSGAGGTISGAGRSEDAGFTDEDAEVVAAALRARGRAEAAAAAAGVAAAGEPGSPGGPESSQLVAFSLPPSANRRLSAAGVGLLVEALAGLTGLRVVNGVVLQDVATAAAGQPPSSPPLMAGGDRAPAPRGLLNLSGSCCGPVALGLLGRMLQTSLPRLAALNLTGCEAGPVGVSYLAVGRSAGSAGGTVQARGGGSPGAVALGGLHTACLADNDLGAEGVASFMEAVVGGSAPGSSAASPRGSGAPPSAAGGGPAAVRVLDLSVNKLGDGGCQTLARFLPALGPSLRVLALSHNGTSTEGARALAAALGACGGLQELLLGGNQLGDQAVRALAGVLQRLTGLQVLQLQDNPRLSSDGVAGLAAALPALPALRELDLSRCHCGDEGARHLAKALAGHPSLTSVALEGCKLRADAASHLASALSQAPPPPLQLSPLSALSLARNQLGDRGAAALADALGRNRSLTSLDLRANGIGLAGCRGLSVALRERNASLRVLAVAGNEMEEDALGALEALAASRRQITVLAAHRPSSNTAAGPSSASPANARAGRPRSTPAQPLGTHATRQAVPDATPAAASTVPDAGVEGRSPALNPELTSAGSRRQLSAGAGPRAALAPGLPSSRELRGEGAGGSSSAGVPAGPAAAGALAAASSVRALERGPQRTAAEDLLARIGVGVSGSGSRGGRGAHRSPGFALEGLVGDDDEDLEDLLRRYRTGPLAAETQAALAEAEGAGGASLLDLGYTGMKGEGEAPKPYS